MGLGAGLGCSDNGSNNSSPPADAGGGDVLAEAATTGVDASSDAAADATTDAGGDAGNGDGGPSSEVIYASSGAILGAFDLSLADGTLTPTSTTTLGQIVQFGWFDPALLHLYVGATTASSNYLYAYTVDPTSGLLTALGSPLLSPNGRVINLTVSPDDKYLLSVHNVTETYSVFALNSDSTIGSLVPQLDGGDVDVGAYLHQVRVDPTGKYVTICDRGNDPTTVTTDAGVTTVPEQVGHLHVFSFASGVLTPVQDITFPSGVGPRHLDFHPTQPWVYLSAERGNRLIMYTFEGGTLTEKYNVTSVANPADSTITNATEAVNGQRAGAIMVDPSGKYLWITNRDNQVEPDPGPPSDAGADAAVTEAGSDAAGGEAGTGSHDAGADAAGDGGGGTDAAAPVSVFAGLGENNVALFSIDQTTGAPTFVAAWDTHGIEPRTFAVDPAHKYLIVGNQKQEMVRQGATLSTILPNVAVFQIGADGQLTFVKTYDQTSGEVVWVGSR
jgi:6-phosphogluconolactonase (cycloisomerase 2 family)